MTSLEFCKPHEKIGAVKPKFLAVPYIHAMQSHGIIGMSKHFVANDQETNRESTSTWG
jgi:hypothetical protein